MPKNHKQHTKMVENGTYHIRVYHPNKPDKIRVVFNCSAEFNRRSITKELIPGPDLANQLVNVLTRFRENKVVFMADVEKMYFQIFVAEEHQCLLRFLWWKNGSILDEQLFMRCVCICLLAYHLELTAINIENKHVYGKEAEETLKNNFNVYDFLKYV